MNKIIHTIGHSTHALENFIGLLSRFQITAVADVRSSPYSRFNSQFNRELVKSALKKVGIAYVFLGFELGGRIEDQSCYLDGKVQYDRVVRTAVFQRGLERILGGMENYKIALMCAEKDPLTCHRSILVAKVLREEGVEVQHILGGGEVESQDEMLVRLKALLKLPDMDVFRSHEQVIAEAYATQAGRIAFVEDVEEAREAYFGSSRGSG